MNGAGEPRGCPKYLKLAKTFERQLRAGVLRVGDRLPSVRQLRTHHRVSAATAVGCYLWLERQGYVRARPKSGFFVSRTPQAEGPAPISTAARAARSASAWAACSSTQTPPRTAPASPISGRRCTPRDRGNLHLCRICRPPYREAWPLPRSDTRASRGACSSSSRASRSAASSPSRWSSPRWARC